MPHSSAVFMDKEIYNSQCEDRNSISWGDTERNFEVELLRVTENEFSRYDDFHRICFGSFPIS